MRNLRAMRTGIEKRKIKKMIVSKKQQPQNKTKSDKYFLVLPGSSIDRYADSLTDRTVIKS